MSLYAARYAFMHALPALLPLWYAKRGNESKEVNAVKRILSAVLACAMLLCMVPLAGAASDIDAHWSRPYITSLNKIGVINPSSSGNYSPDQAIMRWEFMRYINRALGYTEKAQISFSDVGASDVYYETVQIAVAHGYINGTGNNKMNPKGTLTREQAATILGRLHKVEPKDSALAFTDSEKISDWSRGYIADAVGKGYIDGYTDGSFVPQRTITRGEIAKILYFFLGSSLRTQSGALTESGLISDVKNVTVVTPGTLTNLTVPGNLYVTEGTLDGTVRLENVTVKGDLVISGGDVTMDGVNASRMVVSTPLDQPPHITCTGATNIGSTEVQTTTTLRESGLDVSAGGLSDISIVGQNAALTLDASVWSVTAEKNCTLLTTSSAMINELTANAAITVTGGGSIEKAMLNVNNCDLLMRPSSLQLASGVSAVIAGETTSSASGVTVSPAYLTFDIRNMDALAHSFDLLFNADKNDVAKVTCNGTALRLGTDYNLLSDKNGIRLYKAYLATLPAGAYSLDIAFTDGTKGTVSIAATNSAVSAVSPTSVTFDKYVQSAGYADVVISVAFPSGTRLEDVKFGSTVLERGTDYYYNAETAQVTVLRDYLARRTNGSYTLNFVPSQGSALSCSLTITDSSPVNTVTPSKADFDANPNSGGYADLEVTLTPADGATLSRIVCQGKTLEENWQYTMEGNKVRISKSAITSFTGSGRTSVDFGFIMSSGRNPTLTVNFITTYALTANVVDDLGQPVQGATVEFLSQDDGANAPQTLVTDEYGKATVYVRKGSYKLTVTDSRFTAQLTQTVSVNTPKTVNMTGEILENVEITVTNQYGAKLSGAMVAVGGKTLTTGADGVAAFSLKRSAYTVQIACAGYAAKSLPITVNGPVKERVTLSAQ